YPARRHRFHRASTRPFGKGLPALRAPIEGATQQYAHERGGHGASLNSRVRNGYSHLPNTPDAEGLGKGVPPERCPGVLGSRSWTTTNLRAREGALSARADGLANLIKELEGPGASAYQSRQAAAHLRFGCGERIP